MREGWLIYCERDIDRNRSSIKMFMEKCLDIKIRLVLIVFEKLSLNTVPDNADPSWDFLYDGEEIKKPSIVINRCRSYELAKKLKINGVRVYNSPSVARLGNDKLYAVECLKKAGVNVIPTYTYDKAKKIIDYPVVLKTKSGHGGEEVFLVNSAEECENLYKQFGEELIVQDYIRDGNCDMRVYVVGNRILFAMLRESDSDFRSNYSLGGRANIVSNIPDEIQAQVDIIINALGEVAYCGIDFIKSGNTWVFNEIEDAVGAKMVYTATGLDPIGEFVKYIGESVNE